MYETKEVKGHCKSEEPNIIISVHPLLSLLPKQGVHIYVPRQGLREHLWGIGSATADISDAHKETAQPEGSVSLCAPKKTRPGPPGMASRCPFQMLIHNGRHLILSLRSVGHLICWLEIGFWSATRNKVLPMTEAGRSANHHTCVLKEGQPITHVYSSHCLCHTC